MRKHPEQEQEQEQEGRADTPAPTPGPAPDIWEAKARVMQAVPYVYKGSRTKAMGRGQDYSFASEAELIAALRPAMLHERIVSTPRRIRVLRQHTYTARGGSVMHSVRIMVYYRFTHAPSRTHDWAVVIGEAADSGDKAASKAMTIAFKYALRQFFGVETGDDPDKYHSDESEAAPEQVRPDSFSLCRESLKGATDVVTLERYWDVATKGRPYRPDQIESLRVIYLDRLNALGGRLDEGKQPGQSRARMADERR
jgi:hypothetical protein